MTEYHGWGHGSRAVYVQADPTDGTVKMGIQQDRSTAMLATFYNEDAAQIFMEWMDTALAQQARVHADLLDKLQNEQPLLFSQAPGPRDVVDLDDEP